MEKRRGVDDAHRAALGRLDSMPILTAQAADNVDRLDAAAVARLRQDGIV